MKLVDSNSEFQITIGRIIMLLLFICSLVWSKKWTIGSNKTNQISLLYIVILEKEEPGRLVVVCCYIPDSMIILLIAQSSLVQEDLLMKKELVNLVKLGLLIISKLFTKELWKVHKLKLWKEFVLQEFHVHNGMDKLDALLIMKSIK